MKKTRPSIYHCDQCGRPGATELHLDDNKHRCWYHPECWELLQRIEAGKGPLITLAPGMVCTHEDRDGVHFAILLKVQRRTCIALFLVSKPLRDSRPATFEELALTGFHGNVRKTTRLWKVERAKSEFVPRGPIFPEHRIKSLWEEFESVPCGEKRVRP